MKLATFVANKVSSDSSLTRNLISRASSQKPAVKMRPRTAAAASSAAMTADNNLNLINNNGEDNKQAEEKASKRRSYHPQDFLSKILTSPADENTFRQLKRSSGFPKVSFSKV